MPNNQIKPFATGAGANVLDPNTYATQGYIGQGFQNGVAQPYDINTVLRQLSTVAAALAQFVADNQTSDVLDNGNISALEAQIKAAISGVAAQQVPAQTTYGIQSKGGLAKDGNNNFGFDLTNLNAGGGFASPDILSFRRAADGALLAGTIAQIAATVQSIISGNNVFVQNVTNPNIYFDTGAGSDSNIGTVASAPVQTLGKALQIAAMIGNFATSQVVIQGVGTAQMPGTLPPFSGLATIQGGSAGLVITGATPPGGGNALMTISNNARVNLVNLTLQNTGTSVHTLAVGSGAQVLATNVLFAQDSGQQSNEFHIELFAGITLVGCSARGNMGGLVQAYGTGANFQINPGSAFNHNTPTNYSAATLVAQNGGQITLGSGSSFTGSTVTGAQKLMSPPSVITCNGVGIPGNSAGTVPSGAYFYA